MCGISALTLSKPSAHAWRAIYEIERALSPKRGNHSWGIVAAHDGKFRGMKALGPIAEPMHRAYPYDGTAGDGWDQLTRLDLPPVDAIMGHNRFASMGAINLVNAHPFLHGDYAFAHNGTVHGTITYDEKKWTPEGTTDSERVFLHFLTHIDDGKTVPEAFRECFRLNGRTNLIALNKDGAVSVICSDALVRIEGTIPGTDIQFTLWCSEPAESETLGVTEKDERWVPLQRGQCEQGREGKATFSDQVVPAVASVGSQSTYYSGWGHQAGSWSGDWGACDTRGDTPAAPARKRRAEHKGSTPRFPCPHEGCDRVFAVHKGLYEHCVQKHEVRRGNPLVCPGENCGIAHKTPADLSKHLYDDHQEPMNLTADERDQALLDEMFGSMDDNLPAGMLPLGDGVYECAKCHGTVHGSKDSVLAHMMREHSGKPAAAAPAKDAKAKEQCPLCPNAYIQKQTLEMHLRLDHRGQQKGQAELGVRYKCPQGCKGLFTSEEGLNSHRRFAHGHFPTAGDYE